MRDIREERYVKPQQRPRLPSQRILQMFAIARGLNTPATVRWFIAAAGTLVITFGPIESALGQEMRTPAGLNDEDLRTATDFRILFEERETILPRIALLEHRVSELYQEGQFIMDTLSLKADSGRLADNLAIARNDEGVDPDYMFSLERNLAATSRNLARARVLPAELSQTESEYESLRRRLLIVEQRIASIFDRARDLNSFRSTITIIFAALVFFVISGFYLIAWHKQGVATTIFSGEMGMQFVTLFLIVIAIILFGMLGTLEGRELGPLLGGLSGYILGRQSGQSLSTREDVATTASPPPQASH